MALLCLLCTITISAQKAIVYGQITDNKTGKPIANAGVSIAKDGKGTIADVDGRYTLNIQGRQQVRLNFQYLGYKTESREIALRDSVCCNIRLKPIDNTLDEVTVTTRSEVRRLRESAMPISVIGQRQLQGTASNINDVLARTVGVTVRNTGGMGSASRISVRGLEGKRMGMYIDETPVATQQLRGTERYSYKHD